jgi:uncharacterized protein (DUF1501 family)
VLSRDASPTDASVSRRHFLAGAALAAAGACAAPATRPKAVPADLAVPGPTGGISGPGPLVVVTLVGGNDALNTVIPVGDPRYASLRAGLAVDPSSALPLDQGFALHPSLSRCKALWDQGRLAVVHGVGFERLDRSHFHCMDVWHAGGVETGPTGWVGRWLDVAGADPLAAVVVGSRLPLLARGERTSAAVVPPGPFELALDDAVAAGFAAQVAEDGARNELEALVARSGAHLLSVASNVGGPLASQPDGETLGDRLATVAALIAAGLPTRVYSVELGGFDTHAEQAATHAELLAELDGALGTFFDSVGERSATVVVYSEFGRRVEPNGSGGTDHGRAGTVLVAGRAKGGHHGEPPPLDGLVDGDQRTTTEVTSVYAALLEGVLGVPAGDVLDGSPRPLDLVG